VGSRAGGDAIPHLPRPARRDARESLAKVYVYARFAGVVLNQLLYEMAHLQERLEEGGGGGGGGGGAGGRGGRDGADATVVAEGALWGLIRRIRRIHYVDVGANSRGSVCTDPRVLQAVSRLAQRQALRVTLHGTPRQVRLYSYANCMRAYITHHDVGRVRRESGRVALSFLEGEDSMSRQLMRCWDPKFARVTLLPRRRSQMSSNAQTDVPPQRLARWADDDRAAPLPRQWSDAKRPWIAEEKGRCLRLCREAGLPATAKLYFADEPPSLDMHFRVLDVFEVEEEEEEEE